MRSDVPIAERPGARLNHSVAEKVYVKRGGRRIHVGFYDPSQRVYQWGGDLSKHVYWKRHLMALGPEECEALRGLGPERLEFIDKGTTCYAVSAAVARQRGYWYNGEAGRRFGIPLELFERSAV